jgi:hypothetical protein
MPSEKSHLDLANHNQALISRLLPEIDTFADWVATAAFYKALHVVEAVFATDKDVRHGRDHTHREECLKKNPRYKKIYQHYRVLLSVSKRARYLQDVSTCFSDSFSPQQVIDEVLKHDLHQVEVSAAKFLKDADRLVRVEALWATEVPTDEPTKKPGE